MKSGRSVYDEVFHEGLNIIHGENGAGKSTIADCIFYILGGEKVKWKPEAASCTHIIAEVEVSGTWLTLRREISEQRVPMIEVFNGNYEAASKQGFEGWNAYQPSPLKKLFPYEFSLSCNQRPFIPVA